MFEIKLDIPKVEAEIVAAIQSIDKAQEAALGNVAKGAQGVAQEKVEAIEKRPIPSRSQVSAYKSKGGRRRSTRPASNAPAWKRSGDLAESAKAPPMFESKSEVNFEADTPYANRRHGLGIDWTPAQPALGQVRANPFFDQAEDEIGDERAADLFVQGFNSVFEK